jgi:TatD DNase family protein
LIDTHCHLAFRDFDGRVDEVVAAARAAGVRGMITVSTTSANARENLAIAERFDGVWCTAGVHPLYADEPVEWPVIAECAAAGPCVAWGELGLDNHYDEPPRDVQERVLEAQLALIDSKRREGLEMPVVVHCRKAVDELLAVFRRADLDPTRFVFHCFTETPDAARRILDFGAWISFTGVVTFKNAPEVAEAARLVPLDRIMVETDSPFLSPEPLRKVRPNQPAHVVHVARFIADLRGEDPAEFERVLDANAERFFGITIPEG